MSNLIAIITGSEGQIGKALVTGFEKHGYKVWTIDKVASTSKSFRHSRVDLTSREQVDSLVSDVLEEPGPISVLINAAGISIASEDPFSDEVLQTNLDVNLRAPFLISGSLIKKNIELGLPLSIINITSLGATFGFPGNPSYQVSKAALGALTKALSVDYAKFSIRVNNLVPGYIKSGMTHGSWNNPQLREARTARTSIGRWGDPGEIVGPALFLAGPESLYITGTDLYVDGGWSSKGL